MLTSSASQYLHPDYLQPLPTTLDAKKSPLALLAQTCSSIGKDTTPSKPIIPPLEKKESEKDKSAPENLKRPASEERDRDNDSKPGFRTFPPKEIPPLVPIANSSASEKSGSGETKSSSSGSSGCVTSTTVTSSITRPMSATGSSSSSNGHHAPPRASSARGEDSRGSDHHDSHRVSSASPSRSKTSSVSIQSSPLMTTSTSSSSLAPSVLKHPTHHPSYLSAYGSAHALGYPLSLLSHGLHMDGGAAPPYPTPLAAHTGLSGLSAAAAAAAAAQSSALKVASGSTTPLSPYVAYARVRTPSGATTLVPVCRDPFCTNCQLTLNNAHLSATCTAPGCAQCAHEKSLTNLTAGLGMGLNHLVPSLSSGVSLSSSASALSSFHSMYPHAALSATQVCNWVTPGGEYCGKRFTTSEELLQHLRTHTSGVDATSFAAAGYGLGLPPAALSACHSHYPSGPLSPNTLRRTYPTSLSPVTGLLSHSRYHPYKSPLTTLPTAPAPGQAPYPGMSAYYPYGLYGPRLGAAAVP